MNLQFATNRIKIGPLEPEIQPAKVELRHYAGTMTSRDVIVLPPVTISLYNNCSLTVEDYTKDTQEISCGQLPYRRSERKMFVIYSSAHQKNQRHFFPLSVFPMWTNHKMTLLWHFSNSFYDSKVNVMVSTIANNYIRPILKFGSQNFFIVCFFNFFRFYFHFWNFVHNSRKKIEAKSTYVFYYFH